ncbi:hypothetical protein Slin_5042 [Spirosoma linguale DSM 74]|uniref:Uncharacterized protein n=1 Tax=Spirosoma linguale (strain ATCC 33905 / DSM 74 / LMG 10896 / Claus 1) TaxID=504472 RepID=D2QD12_SPILD|nr:hypothetical protein Slin_5042 [Spirosoma linguale DSM 74]
MSSVMTYWRSVTVGRGLGINGPRNCVDEENYYEKQIETHRLENVEFV